MSVKGHNWRILRDVSYGVEYRCEYCGMQIVIPDGRTLDEGDSVTMPCESVRAYQASGASGGVGSILKKMIAAALVKPNKNCNCADLAYKMDIMGPQWCRQKEKLILDRMQENAKKLRIPFSRTAARLALRVAILIAEKRYGKR